MRRPRIHYPGATYHVMARGVDGRSVFMADHDRLNFIARFERICLQHAAHMMAYCLMENHFHFAIQIGASPLGLVMQRILSGYAAAFNHRWHRAGHLFQARYKSCLCLNDAYLIALIRYIHRNPVRAGLVASPGAWKWSSFARYASSGRDGNMAAVEDLPLPVGPESGFDPWFEQSQAAIPKLMRLESNRIQSLDELASGVCDRRGIRIEQVRGRQRTALIVDSRREIARAGLENGHSLVSIARWLKVSPASVTRYAARVMQ
jgi:REP element-mobilizing transposase RayT